MKHHGLVNTLWANGSRINAKTYNSSFNSTTRFTFSFYFLPCRIPHLIESNALPSPTWYRTHNSCIECILDAFIYRNMHDSQVNAFATNFLAMNLMFIAD